MKPILFHIGDIAFPSYFTFAALSFVSAALLASYRAEKLGLDPVRYIDLSLVIAVGSFIGARLFYILTVAPRQYLENPLDLFRVWEGGFVFYGGLIFGTLFGLAFAKYKKIPIGPGLDVAAPSMAIGMTIGRMACFLSGCCYGEVCNLDWPLGVVFNEVDGISPQARPLGVPLVPTQIMSSALHLSIFFILIFVSLRKRFSGQLWALYMILYSIGRAVVEMFRDDKIRGEYFGGLLSTSQVISAAIFIAGIFFYMKGRAHYRASNAV